jgi:hypothetical protein
LPHANENNFLSNARLQQTGSLTAILTATLAVKMAVKLSALPFGK